MTAVLSRESYKVMSDAVVASVVVVVVASLVVVVVVVVVVTIPGRHCEYLLEVG